MTSEQDAALDAERLQIRLEALRYRRGMQRMFLGVTLWLAFTVGMGMVLGLWLRGCS